MAAAPAPCGLRQMPKIAPYFKKAPEKKGVRK